MDSEQLETTEEQQEVAEYQLDYNRYIYLDMRDEMDGDELLVKRTGRYQGKLVIQTIAQCWVDFEGTVDVTNLVGNSQFLYTALVLSATSVHRALWLWAKGYITKESHKKARLNKSSGIIKVMGQDSKFTKMTNFSKDSWYKVSDMHMHDLLVIGPEKLHVLEGDIRDAANLIYICKGPKKSKEGPEEKQLDKKAWGTAFLQQAPLSDSDF